MPPPENDFDEPFPRFLLRAQKIVDDATFIISTFPNAEKITVERYLRQLLAIRRVMDTTSDSVLTREEIQQCIECVDQITPKLQEFCDLEDPPVQPPRTASSTFGRPAYDLDIDKALHLHSLGNSWEEVSEAMGVDRKTIYNHLTREGRSTSRPQYTEIDNDELDDIVSFILLEHPLSGQVIMQGHLKRFGINLPTHRIGDSLRRVDEIGTILRWHGVTKRRVYRVRGSNALWHHDGNEKLRPWGFYVHGCIDGYSRLLIYLVCSNNKRAKTVATAFERAVEKYGWPSRMRGDFGTENNQVERLMIRKWGRRHRAYLRGRSVNNIRIERVWRDVLKDTLEFFRQIFLELERLGLLDPSCPTHLVCLYLVYQPRIQQSLDSTITSWNNHKIRTAGNRTPIAMFELSKERAINAGYWHNDPGDNITDVDEDYGDDGEARMVPPEGELANDPQAPRPDAFNTVEEERNAGIFVTEDDAIREAREHLESLGFDFGVDDGNWGMDLYCAAALKLTSYYEEDKE